MKSGVGIFSPTGEAMRIERERDFARELVRQIQDPISQIVRRVEPHRGGKNSREKSAAVRHQKSALLADQPDPHHPVRDGGRHAGVAAAGQLCRGCFLAGIPRPRRGRAHRAGQRRRDLFAGHQPGIQIRASTATWASSPARRWAGWWSATRRQIRPGAANCCIRCCRGSAKVKYHGPVQVTAVKRAGKWLVIEYNIRIGVTSGPMILRMLSNPLETVLRHGAEREIGAAISTTN